MGLSGRKFTEKGDISNRIYVLFSYTITHLNNSDKVRFYYALKGRDGKSGFIHRTNSIQLAKTVFLIPTEHEKDAIDFLSYWKCKFNKRRVKILDDTQD